MVSQITGDSFLGFFVKETTSGFHPQRASNAEKLPCYEVIMESPHLAVETIVLKQELPLDWLTSINKPLRNAGNWFPFKRRIVCWKGNINCQTSTATHFDATSGGNLWHLFRKINRQCFHFLYFHFIAMPWLTRWSSQDLGSISRTICQSKFKIVGNWF